MEQSTDERFMKLALSEAQIACDKGEVPIGAVIVGDGFVIARSHNLTETLADPTAHAEMQAITSATSAIGGKYLRGCTLYVTVEPCPMCAAALYWAQIDRIVYGAPDIKRGYTTISEKLIHPRTKVSQNVLQDECTKIIQDFFKSKR